MQRRCLFWFLYRPYCSRSTPRPWLILESDFELSLLNQLCTSSRPAGIFLPSLLLEVLSELLSEQEHLELFGPSDSLHHCDGTSR